VQETSDYLQFVLAPQMFTGLTMGVAVVLAALGLTIIFGLLDVINMAHGAFYAVGAYLALALERVGFGYIVLLPLVVLVMAAFGYLLQYGLIQHVLTRGRDRHVTTLMLTLGLAMVIEDANRAIFGVETLRPANPIPGSAAIFGMVLPNYRLFLISAGILIVAAVMVVIYRTRFGAMVRAAAFDRQMAASLGVPVKRIYGLTFALGVALTGLAGALLAPVYSIFPTMGHDFLVMAFIVVIVGGLGSVTGAVAAGFLLTQVQALASLVVSPVWGSPIILAVMVFVLIMRPGGLFGRLGHV